MPATTASQAPTVAQVRSRLVEALGGRHVAALEKAGNLVVHDTDPTGVGAAGFVDGKGVMHLIAPNLNDDALGVALHEEIHLLQDSKTLEGDRATLKLARAALRLFGLKNVIGSPSFTDLVEQAHRLAVTGNEAAVRALAQAKKEAPHDVDGELVAYLVEYAPPTNGFVRKVLAAIRAALYRMGVRIDLAPADLRALALSALKARAKAPTDADKAEVERQMKAVKEVRDDKGRLLAPNGKPSRLNERQWKQVRTPFFKAWFGDWETAEAASKVVDENGEPLVMYHGSASDFVAFEPERAGEKQYADWGVGSYFTPSMSDADHYREEAAKSVDREADALWAQIEAIQKQVVWKNGAPVYPDRDRYEDLMDEWRARRVKAKDEAGSIMPVNLSIKNPMIVEYQSTANPTIGETARQKGHDGIIVLASDKRIKKSLLFTPPK
jgi:hypothetical protein